MSRGRDRVLSMLPRGAEGAEIGVLRGDGAAAILAAARPARLWLIDPWEEAPEPERADALYAAGRLDMEAVHAGVLARFAQEIARGRVRVSRGGAADAPVADASLGFAYVDGDHREAGALADLDWAVAKVRPGGVIAVDDYHLGGWWGDGVMRAAHRCLGRHPAALEVAGAPEGHLVLRRR